MASVGHVVIGAAAARFRRGNGAQDQSALAAAALWSALSLLPDADVIGFALGVEYADPWGHRGATHSIAFAALAGVAVWVAARAARGVAAWKTALLAFAVVATHPLLDTLTDGGLGCALLWPLSYERFFAPWRPLPVAPIGPAFLSMEGLRITAVELAAFSPFLIYAAWPRRAVYR